MISGIVFVVQLFFIVIRRLVGTVAWLILIATDAVLCIMHTIRLKGPMYGENDLYISSTYVMNTVNYNCYNRKTYRFMSRKCAILADIIE